MCAVSHRTTLQRGVTDLICRKLFSCRGVETEFAQVIDRYSLFSELGFGKANATTQR